MQIQNCPHQETHLKTDVKHFRTLKSKNKNQMLVQFFKSCVAHLTLCSVFPGACSTVWNVQLFGGWTVEALREIRVEEAACETVHV